MRQIPADASRPTEQTEEYIVLYVDKWSQREIISS